uniref:Protein kinase domain-containing protein n=1 Tax=Panagrolaimus sp. PS1159 TaxID=55785 RepID=A0AC35F8V6_9BILA
MRSRRRHHFEPSRRPSNVPPLLLEPITPNRINLTSTLNNGNNGETDISIIPPSTATTTLTEENSSPSSQDARVITYMKFVEVFMSGKLRFENTHEEHKFLADDLIDLGEIGRGRFGVVNKMKHTKSNKIMAVKKVRITTTTFDDNEDRRLIKQLQNEVQTIRDAATCKEVVSFYGVTFKEGDCMICMELMDISLERMYKTVRRMGSKFSEDVLGIVGVTVLQALNCLKKLKGIMHRDVKPSNILLSLKGDVKLCDFGISGYLENSIAKTKDVGCRPYMAPERLTGSPEGYDIRADVWSLGITMIEVARMHFPYKNFDEQSVFAQIKQVVYGDPQILTAKDGYSYRVVNFVNECLTKEVNDRPNFQMLMETDFYQYFSQLPNKTSIIQKNLSTLYKFDKSVFS